MAVSHIQDAEFGAVAIRRNKLSRSVKLKIDHRGTVSISMPPRAPLFLARSLLHETREQVRSNLISIARKSILLQHGDLIGKTHRLAVLTGDTLNSRLDGTVLRVTLPPHTDIASAEIQSFIKKAALKALRTQAKAYLSRRLTTLAGAHGFGFASIRFSNAGTRWGSCSSNGTISLNIWLMQLPFELIDYVLVHELCHTQHLNHSSRFWQLVEQILPDYKQRRRDLKAMRPYL